MSTDAFEKTSWEWQSYLWQQQIGEWFDYQYYRFIKSLSRIAPEWSISPWVIELIQILSWLILGLFVAWVGWRLWQEFNPYIYSWLMKITNSHIADSQIPTRETSIQFLLTKAQELYQQSNYREACRFLYLATLQQLHEKAIAPQQPSRTDGEYLQLLTSAVTPIQPYETLITTHEQLCFGNANILAENYQQCRQAYQELFNS
ncbi:DUF4129 domain-containing protein [Sphaerospermopsis aphanizomenoides BCCUSP55]|uniref:DUF4129 domain-containing protein n=1 Tax=Sphaerospermopsis aphanizomenoides TaxID=459663 RepID=UPI001902DF4F|nr:DUF4129 domain-containing protein [Sphaerospermopsis aphanizomenoides]MBK1988534.1 DUF4129 domain-containing protein [Sphaerospermopsis aphanizomenoides BCCUSP55]